MKALHLTTTKSGGAGIAAERISDSLNQVGIESHLWDRKQLIRELDFRNLGKLKLYGVSPILTKFQRNLIQKGSELMTPNSLSLIDFSTLDRLDFDLIHIHAFYNLLNARSFKQLSQLNKPVVVTLHDLRLLTGGCHAEIGCKEYLSTCSNCPKVYSPFQLNVENQKKKLTSVIEESSNITLVSPSEWLSRRILNSGKFPNSRVRVINNPVPSSFEFSRSGRIQRGRLVIGFSAYDLQSPYKGLDVLIDAIRELPKKVQSKIEIHLKGNNFPQDDYFFEIDALIINVGRIEMREFYRGVDAIVVPSLADNFPSVAIEAIASSCTLISSDSGGLEEISERNNGFIFASKDHIKLAEIILKLTQVDSPQRAIYDGSYSFESIGMQYKELYSDISG